MRRLIVLSLGACVAVGCATRGVPARPPAIPVEVRLAAAGALVRAGCLDCLLDAFREYDALRREPVAADAATAAAARTAVLIALRERELGTLDEGYLNRARELAVATPSVAAALDPFLEIAEAMPSRTSGGARQITDEQQLANAARAYRNRDAWTDQLRGAADEHELAAYLYVAFSCAYGRTFPIEPAAILDAVPRWRDTPLIAFRAATCAATDRAALDMLHRGDERFVEVRYFLGEAALSSGKIDEAELHFERAYAWHPNWPATTYALATVYTAEEDIDRAIDFYDRTLALVAVHPDALLGKARALTYQGQYAEALEVIDALLALERWYVGDARYWRALNEAQLARYDEAWDDVERAAKLVVNAEVPKLAGIIAYRRRQIAVAREKFEEARSRNPADCETGFYLHMVLAEQRDWIKAAAAAAAAAMCFDEEETRLQNEIGRLRSAAIPEARRARQIAARERQLGAGARMRATCWFNAAVANFNLAREDEARRNALRVFDDEQFGERARELLSRMK